MSCGSVAGLPGVQHNGKEPVLPERLNESTRWSVANGTFDCRPTSRSFWFGL